GVDVIVGDGEEVVPSVALVRAGPLRSEGDEQRDRRSHRSNVSEEKARPRSGSCVGEGAYFFESILVSSLFALPLPFALAFLSPLAFFLEALVVSPVDGVVVSFFASVPDGGALGAVSDFGACANAVNANAEAINVASNFLSIAGLLLWCKTIRCGSIARNAPPPAAVDTPGIMRGET